MIRGGQSMRKKVILRLEQRDFGFEVRVFWVFGIKIRFEIPLHFGRRDWVPMGTQI